IKNAPDLYAETAGIPRLDLQDIERSKNFLLAGSVEYEFRTTVVKGLHTSESLIEAAKWITGANEYYLQQFKDSGDVIAIGGLSAYNEKEMYALADAVSPYVPGVQVRGI
ncbi:MAG: anaerobic ribonucleoside-triphosphate reductase activating protein, partial [Oscillospiraceae bacterium]|nr:anaerobic ribonucleoside-triphosphate reductase activating protein [Oscillospiraceae bacterium]